MSIGHCYLKWEAILYKGSSKNGVKIVSWLLSLKLIWFELEVLISQAVFFIIWLIFGTKYSDKKVVKKFYTSACFGGYCGNMWVKKSIKPTLDACRIFAHLGGVDFFGEIIFAVYLKMTKHKKLTPPRCAKSDISKKRALTKK